MRKLLFLLWALSALPALGQNVRYDAPYPSVSSQFQTPFLVANVPPNSPTISVCHSPANAVPCTNYVTVYNSVGGACPNGAQDTPQPQPSACQSTGDAQGNIGFWAPPGTYDYTVCIAGTASCFGPYTVTLSFGTSSTIPSTNVAPTLTVLNVFGQPSISYGSVTIGSIGQGQAKLVITSPGPGPVTFNSFTFSGSSEFSIVQNTCTTGLPTAGTCTLLVNFTPTVTGAVTGTLTISETGASNSPQSIPLSGAGVAAPPPITVSSVAISPTTASLAVGSSQIFQLTCTNSDGSITTNCPGSFTVSGSGGSSSPTVAGHSAPGYGHLSCSLNPTAGDTLVIWAYATYSSATLTFSISDTEGNTFTLPSSGVVTNSNGSSGVGLYYAVAKSTGADTINLAAGVGVTLSAVAPMCVDLTGTPNAPLDNASGRAAGSSTASMTTASLTLSGTNDLCIGFFEDPSVGPGSFTLGSGWTPGFTAGYTDTGFVAGLELQAGLSSSSTATATDLSATEDWIAYQGCFLGSAGGASVASVAPAMDGTSGTVTGLAAGSSTLNAAPVFNVNNAVAPVVTGSSASAIATFPNGSVQLQGDRNVVFVSWAAATGTVSTVTDLAGNSYSAACTAVTGNSLFQQIWISAPIVAYTNNQITVTPTSSESNLSVRVSEWSGIPTGSQVDVCGGTTGSSATASKSITTINATDLVLAGVFSPSGPVANAVSPYTTRTVDTQGNITSSAVVYSAGSTTASAVVNSSNPWNVAMVSLDTPATSATITVTQSNAAYTLSAPPPVTWSPYGQNATSITTKPLPSDVLSHCWGNSGNCSTGDAIAQALFSAAGSDNLMMAVQIPFAPGSGASSFSADEGVPIYYSTATNPWYQTGTSCNYTTPGLNAVFHAPSGAYIGGAAADKYFSVYDQSLGIIVEFYAYFGGANNTISSLPSSSCAGTGPSSCAVTIPGVSACSVERVGIDKDWGWFGSLVTIPGLGTIGQSTINAVGFASNAGVLRQNELAAGNIAHALLGNVTCDNSGTQPFPGTHADATHALNPGVCPSPDTATTPASGMLFFLDYPPSQLATIKAAVPLWQYGVISAVTHYGIYATATGGTFGGIWVGTGGYESQTAYNFSSVTDSYLATLCAQGGWVAGTCPGGGPYNPLGYAFQNVPLLTGPNCPSVACDISKHMHLADECVAAGLTGLQAGSALLKDSAGNLVTPCN